MATSALLGAGIGSASADIEGVDVSRYQHPSGARIDWSAVEAAGQSFAVIKGSEGRTVTNPYLADDFAQARTAGLVRGAYHFARPDTSTGDAATEARHFVAEVADVGGFGGRHTLAPVLDLEDDGGLSRSTLVTWTRTWLDTVEDLTGRTPIIYTGPSFWNDHVGSNAFGRYPLWIAHYTTKPSPIIPVGWTAYTFWQYTSSGRVSGIQGAVDRNRFQGAGADLAAMSNGVPTGLTLTSPESVFAGATATVTGELTTASGGPLGGKTVQVLSRAPGATTWTTLATRTTATDGGYSLHVSPDAATEYSARYAGDTRHLRTTSGVSTVTVRTALATDLTVSAAAERITYGQSTRLTGQLSAAGEGPVVGGTVRVQQRPVRTDTWSPLATATTGDDGTYTLRVTPTRRTAYRATYAGDATRAPADTGLVEVKVARRVSAKLSEDRPRVHTRVNLTGQVTPARPGSAVYRQRWSDGRWKRVATSTLSSTGRYTFTIRPERRAAYTYRVVVPHGEGLAHGVSRTVVMRVQ